MCGRFAMNEKTNELLEEIVAEHGAAAIFDWQKYWPEPNYNVAPNDDVPVAAELNGSRMIESVRWGMIPPGSKEFKAKGSPIKNARIETVTTNGMFKRPFLEHRVVVPALGFYEWQDRDDGKQPFFVHRPSGEPLALAGIARTWYDPTKKKGDPDGRRLSMSIITMESHVVPGEVHDREPAILVPEAIDDWLGDHLNPDQLVQLLLSSADAMADDLEYYEVSRKVNRSPGKDFPNTGPELIERA